MSVKYAFAGRCSTEDQQDPVASRNWQFTRANALIESHGEIVTEFFDIGQSRSIPWKRRPQAALLLETLKNPNRGFDAVVIGEPQRAFYGNQFGLTFPVFVHYGVPLWVPEVGGAVDPESEAHDLVMSVFGGVSKGERNRIKIRVRTAMAAQAKIEGRFLGGRPPYGYMLVDAGPHPNPAKAADGKRLHRLELDPITSVVVERIFIEYLSGIGIFAIAQRLTDDGIPCPSAYDRKRNGHREGIAWSKSAVRTILTNPRYTGYAVWNKQRKEELLIDVEDVALGHETKLKWNPKDKWVFSDRPAHPAIITMETFETAQRLLACRGTASTRTTRTRRGYALKSRLRHAQCGRRMQGNWNNGRPNYRCRYPSEYAIANKLDHPLTVYVREDAILAPLDGWLAGAFSPQTLQTSIAQLEASQPQVDVQVDTARRALEEADRKLGRHRAALEAGADPMLVAQWSREVQAERAIAEARLATLGAGQAQGRMSKEQIRDVVDALGGLLKVLQRAEPEDKAEVYRQLGLTLTYDHETQKVLAETQPAPMGVVRVSEGGLEPPRPIKGTSTSS